MPRLFVAVDLPEQIRSQVLALTQFGLPGVRWVKEEQFHLSLRFIGEVDDRLFESIGTCLSKVREDEFDLTLKGIGTFLKSKNPKVIWAGVDKSKSLIRLRNKVEHQLNQLGVVSEGRKFHPHVTLGRVKDNRIKGIGDYMLHYSLFRSETFPVENFVLFSSQLTPNGAIYTKEMVYDLI